MIYLNVYIFIFMQRCIYIYEIIQMHYRKKQHESRLKSFNLMRSLSPQRLVALHSPRPSSFCHAAGEPPRKKWKKQVIFRYICIFSKKNVSQDLNGINLCEVIRIYSRKNTPSLSYIFEVIRIYSEKETKSFVHIRNHSYIFEKKQVLHIYSKLFVYIRKKT